jgi:hypothetical protein
LNGNRIVVISSGTKKIVELNDVAERTTYVAHCRRDEVVRPHKVRVPEVK